MRTLTLLRCDDCSEEFTIGNRCSRHRKGISMEHTTFTIIGTKQVPDTKVKKTYRDRVLKAVSEGKFKNCDRRFISHII